MTAIDRDRLRAYAQDAAIGGQWYRAHELSNDLFRRQDTLFIAAADPDTIRQLLDTLDHAEDEANAIRAELGTLLRLAEERQRVAEAKVARGLALADDWASIARETQDGRIAATVTDLRAALAADKDTP